MNDTTTADNPGGQPLNDQFGLVVDAAGIDCWKVNYCLEKTPAEIAAMWGNWAPTGAILALRAAVAEIERLRAALQEADTMMGHDDAETAWRYRWAFLWPNDKVSGAL